MIKTVGLKDTYKTPSLVTENYSQLFNYGHHSHPLQVSKSTGSLLHSLYHLAEEAHIKDQVTAFQNISISIFPPLCLFFVSIHLSNVFSMFGIMLLSPGFCYCRVALNNRGACYIWKYLETANQNVKLLNKIRSCFLP